MFFGERLSLSEIKRSPSVKHLCVSKFVGTKIVTAFVRVMQVSNEIRVHDETLP